MKRCLTTPDLLLGVLLLWASGCERPTPVDVFVTSAQRLPVEGINVSFNGQGHQRTNAAGQVSVRYRGDPGHRLTVAVHMPPHLQAAKPTKTFTLTQADGKPRAIRFQVEVERKPIMPRVAAAPPDTEIEPTEPDSPDPGTPNEEEGYDVVVDNGCPKQVVEINGTRVGTTEEDGYFLKTIREPPGTKLIVRAKATKSCLEIACVFVLPDELQELTVEDGCRVPKKSELGETAIARRVEALRVKVANEPTPNPRPSKIEAVVAAAPKIRQPSADLEARKARDRELEAKARKAKAAEQEKREQREERARIAREEAEQKKAERAERAREAKERERAAREERARTAQEKAEKKKAERDARARLAREKAEQKRAEREEKAREARERKAAQKAEREERARLARERKAKEKAEREERARIAREAKAREKAEREAKAQKEKDRRAAAEREAMSRPGREVRVRCQPEGFELLVDGKVAIRSCGRSSKTKMEPGLRKLTLRPVADGGCPPKNSFVEVPPRGRIKRVDIKSDCKQSCTSAVRTRLKNSSVKLTAKELRCLREVRHEDKDFLDAKLLLAHVYQRQNRNKVAQELLIEVVGTRKGSVDPEVLARLAEVMGKRKQYQSATKYAHRAWGYRMKFRGSRDQRVRWQLNVLKLRGGFEEQLFYGTGQKLHYERAMEIYGQMEKNAQSARSGRMINTARAAQTRLKSQGEQNLGD